MAPLYLRAISAHGLGSLRRLGFIGDEFQTARKFLLENLTGDGSWRNPRAPGAPEEPQSTPDET